MHARVTEIVGAVPEQIPDGITNFRESALPGVKELGAKGGMMLVDPNTGKGLAITLWEDEETMSASEEAASELRKSAVQALGSTEEPNVERYEVAVFETT